MTINNVTWTFNKFLSNFDVKIEQLELRVVTFGTRQTFSGTIYFEHDGFHYQNEITFKGGRYFNKWILPFHEYEIIDEVNWFNWNQKRLASKFKQDVLRYVDNYIKGDYTYITEDKKCA